MSRLTAALDHLTHAVADIAQEVPRAPLWDLGSEPEAAERWRSEVERDLESLAGRLRDAANTADMLARRIRRDRITGAPVAA